MRLNTSKLKREIAQLKRRVAEKSSAVDRYAKYRIDPAGYARDVLGVDWWSKQIEIAEALLRPPHRVLVKASHSVGKSHLAGGLVNWWYDTRDPGVCLTTAPTARQVHDVLWKEVRRQRKGRPGFPGPKKPRLESSPWHFAYGFTASTGTSFQGQHEAAVLILLDEAVGVDRAIWEACDSMTMGVEFGLVAFCNPTDLSSEFYAREQTGNYHVVTIPCLEHPNIAAELSGSEPPYPSAVRLAWLEDRLRTWATPVDQPSTGDLEFPPGSGRWLHPGPLAEARLLGRWPAVASGVWSEALWQLAEGRQSQPGRDDRPEIGVDVARFGDDYTEFHVRCGPCSLAHLRFNGLDNASVIGHLRRLCQEWASWLNARRETGLVLIQPEEIVCKIDADGMGGRVADHANGYTWLEVSAAQVASHPEDYPNARSELWFATADLAKDGLLSLAKLDTATRQELKRQAMTPAYKLDSAGRRVVESKSDTKKKLGRSPDGMDALNLAYYRTSPPDVVAIKTPRSSWRDRRK